jgi:hypothetical protein
MGRILEGGSVAAAAAVGGGVVGFVLPSADNPVTGIFGLGQTKWFFNNGTFIVPADVSSFRVRLWGGGGLAGGGFAIKVVTGLASGSSVAVTVGLGGGDNTRGGTSSFGAFVSATGGAGSNEWPLSGGTGVGGDFNSIGGSLATTGNTGGGGAAGIFGDGGSGANDQGGNGNAGGGSADPVSNVGGNGISGIGGHGYIGGQSGYQPNGSPGKLVGLDFIATGGGGVGTGHGANGGGGGRNSTTNGGFPAGGARGFSCGAKGLVIVEW